MPLTAFKAAIAERMPRGGVERVRLAADDEVEPHALQPQFQIDQVDGFDLAHERFAAAVDCLVGVQRHAG